MLSTAAFFAEPSGVADVERCAALVGGPNLDFFFAGTDVGATPADGIDEDCPVWDGREEEEEDPGV